MAKPTYEQIIAYAAGTLSPPEAAAVADYLKGHPDAGQVVARYRLAQTTIAGDDGVEPSASAIARAKAIFHTHSAPASAKTGRWLAWLDAVDRLVASVLFDSRLQAAPLRNAATAERIELTVEVGDLEIDVQAERTELEATAALGEPAKWRVLGQVSGERIDGLDVALVAAEGAPVEATTDSRGAFTIEVAPGHYELVLRLVDGRVASVAELELD